MLARGIAIDARKRASMRPMVRRSLRSKLLREAHDFDAQVVRSM